MLNVAKLVVVLLSAVGPAVSTIMSVGQMSVGQMSVGQMSVSQMSVG